MTWEEAIAELKYAMTLTEFDVKVLEQIKRMPLPKSCDESDKSTDTFEKLLNNGFYEDFRKEDK